MISVIYFRIIYQPEKYVSLYFFSDWHGILIYLILCRIYTRATENNYRNSLYAQPEYSFVNTCVRYVGWMCGRVMYLTSEFNPFCEFSFIGGPITNGQTIRLLERKGKTQSVFVTKQIEFQCVLNPTHFGSFLLSRNTLYLPLLTYQLPYYCQSMIQSENATKLYFISFGAGSTPIKRNRCGCKCTYQFSFNNCLLIDSYGTLQKNYPKTSSR